MKKSDEARKFLKTWLPARTGRLIRRLKTKKMIRQPFTHDDYVQLARIIKENGWENRDSPKKIARHLWRERRGVLEVGR